MFALLGSAMHNRVCIAVSNCNPTPSVPSTCSTASLQGVCFSGGIQSVPSYAVPWCPAQPAEGQNAPPRSAVRDWNHHGLLSETLGEARQGKGAELLPVHYVFKRKSVHLTAIIFNSSSTTLWKGSQVAEVCKC